MSKPNEKPTAFLSAAMLRKDFDALITVPALTRYVQAVGAYLPSAPSATAGKIEVREEGGMPVLRFTPAISVMELIREKLEAPK